MAPGVAGSRGSGGQGRRRLAGRGATPPAAQRPGHPRSGAPKSAGGDLERTAGGPARSGDRRPAELVVGRNAVLEALRARLPASAVQVAHGAERDARLTEVLRRAAEIGIAVLEVPRSDLDRRAAGHQGVALSIRPYRYLHPDDLLAGAGQGGQPALLVACDAVTDARNLGAIVRSVAAFGGDGVLLPERRAAGVNAGAWKASAGALARVPVARATNLVRTLRQFAEAGLSVVGLAADGELDIAELELAADPLVLVLGGEGRGLSRLVRESCDLVVGIDAARGVESLNVAVAAGVALYEVARRRRF